jgi:hypothetical protein
MYERLTFADLLDARLHTVATVDSFCLSDPPARPARGYVVADLSGGAEWDGRLTDDISDGQGSFTLRCCGFSREQALRTTDLAMRSMRGWRPFPDGTALRLTDTSEVIRDDSVATDIRYSISLHYRFDI